MDTQTLLVIIIALLSANLIFVGIYIVLILKEVKTTVMKINEILDSAATVSNAVATPIAGASGAISAFTEGVKAFKAIRGLAKTKKYTKKVEEFDED
jgi:hypothetical protein